MKCAQCSSDNPAEAKFCTQCGGELKRRCAQCLTEISAKAKFCHECGTPVGVTPNQVGATDSVPIVARTVPTVTQEMASAAIAPADGTTAERRQLTVIFSDLVSFTQLSQKMDPEDLNTVVHDYYNVCKAVCKSYEGHVANYLGDGVLMFFGYPVAHEDDANRAVRTGLAIIEGVSALNQRTHNTGGIKLQVRVGVHTGLMIVGDDRAGNWQQMALGETLNIAARVQAVGQPDSVVASAVTQKLIEGFFACRSLGIHTLKGVERPMEVFEVSHETTARSRLEAAGRGGLTPLTGRENEVQQLLECWEENYQGKGQAVLLSGEAGIGKSRLVQMLKEHVANVPGAWLTPCQCSPYHKSTAFHHYADLLERVVLKFDRNERPRDRLQKVEGLLRQYGLELDVTLPSLAALLSIPPEAGYMPVEDPQQQKRAIIESYVHILKERSHKQPLLLVVEDLQWADPSSLDILCEVVAAVADHRILALFTCRPDFDSPWKNMPEVKHISLQRLNPQQVRTICLRVAHGKALPEEVIEQIISRTDGVPLFVEELTKMVMESGMLKELGDSFALSGPLPSLAIPTTLQDSLMARLDRLHAVKEIAQVGSVMGREFIFDLMRHVYPLENSLLRVSLAQLVDAELLFQTTGDSDATYTFKHALVQEAAYQSLVKSRRQHYHRIIAQALEEHFPHTAATDMEVLAHHYTEANLPWQAVPYLLKAGASAANRSAHSEAITHLNRAIELLKKLPDNSQRWQHEIQALIALGVSLTATKGYGVKEVERTYTRAQELSEQCGTPGQLFQSRYGLWRLHMLRAEYGIATQQGEELLELANRQDNTAFHIAAHRALGATLFYRGQFQRSNEHVNSVIAVTTTEGDSDTLVRDIYDVVDPRVTCRSYLSWILWMLGHVGQAQKESQRAIALAEQLQHPFSIALALSFATWLEQFCGNVARVKELAARAMAHCKMHGFPFWIGWNQVMLGWAAAHEKGTIGDAVSLIHKGLAYWNEKGSNLGRGYFLCLLAETHMRRDEWAQSMDALSQAQAFANETDERYWEAERFRLNGELLMRQGQSSEQAEIFFQQALAKAREQSSRSLELRAATSLAQLARKNGRAGEAKATLAAVLTTFAEEQDTPDMAAARALLAELA